MGWEGGLGGAYKWVGGGRYVDLIKEAGSRLESRYVGLGQICGG